MGDSPDAVAPAAASAKVEDTLGARAAAALASSGASSGAQPAGAASPSGDWATWARQVEAEFARVHKRLDDNYAELSALASSTREAAFYNNRQVGGEYMHDTTRVILFVFDV